MKFAELKLSGKSLKSIKNYGYEETTEVQEMTIPRIMRGKDLIVRSQTGTGKTAAFSIGLMERIVNGQTNRVIVLVPTRELAVQVSKEMRGLSQVHQLRICAVYGGTPINMQIKDIRKNYHVLVATPGRLLDLIRRGEVEIPKFNAVVLDEADHMLDIGFQKDILKILDMVPKESQFLLFSATIDADIKQISARYLSDAEMITIGDMAGVSTVQEKDVVVSFSEKFPKLMEILRSHEGMKVLVFLRTKRGVVSLKRRLEKNGFSGVGMLQGNMTQSRRLRMLDRYREDQLAVLVATNVAARGLHVDDVNIIINYDEAEDKKTYLHRIGRTGRMGKEGKVINMICRGRPYYSRGRSEYGTRRPSFGKNSARNRSLKRRH